MRVKFLRAFLLGIGVIASYAAPAAAVQYNGNTVYKATENGITTVYIDGIAGNKVAVDLGQMTKTTSKLAAACGDVRISIPKGNPNFNGLIVDGTAINYASLPTQTLPTCKNGTFSVARTANFKTPKGQVVIVGKTPNHSVSITVAGESLRNLAINGCGTAVLHASKGEIPATFTVNGTSYTLASLPDAGHGPVCKRSASGTYSAYTPSSWSAK